VTGRPYCSCHPVGPGLPSELLEPALAGAFSLALRELLRSELTDSDVLALVWQTRALSRVAICARATDGGPNGAHASIATGNLLAMVQRLPDMEPAERREMLERLRAYV
jgi:hypothetical protein